MAKRKITGSGYGSGSGSGSGSGDKLKTDAGPYPSLSNLPPEQMRAQAARISELADVIAKDSNKVLTELHAELLETQRILDATRKALCAWQRYAGEPSGENFDHAAALTREAL